MRLFLLMFIALLSAGCELWYDASKQQGDLRIRIATSPKAELSEAYLSIIKVEVQHQAGQWHEVPLSAHHRNTNWHSIQLSNPLTLARSNTLPEGHYRAIKVHFEPFAGRAVQHDSGWELPLYTSNVYTAELVTPLYVESDHSSTALLWLDLQHSIALYEDTNETYYRLNSPGLYAYNEGNPWIQGDIANSTWNNLNCPTPTFNDQGQLVGAYAYLYHDQQQSISRLPDIQLGQQQAPFMSVPVYQHRSGSYYYNSPPLKQGRYIVAITCTGLYDNPFTNNSSTVYMSSGIRVRLNRNVGFRVSF